MEKLIKHCSLGLLLVCIICSPCFGSETGANFHMVALDSFLGDWSEHWGTPGKTDVTYHDQYRISRDDSGGVKVTILNRDQLIKDARIENNTLKFTQRTDTYIIRYSLTLRPDKKWLVGTVVTPKKVVNVKWKRTTPLGLSETRTSKRVSNVNIDSFLGDWREHWGTPGKTDVTYHDQYRISRVDSGTVKVTILNRDQVIRDERIENNTLKFTQRTDVYTIRYSLKRQPDGKWLVGTVTTPKKVVKVKWKRVR